MSGSNFSGLQQKGSSQSCCLAPDLRWMARGSGRNQGGEGANKVLSPPAKVLLVGWTVSSLWASVSPPNHYGDSVSRDSWKPLADNHEVTQMDRVGAIVKAHRVLGTPHPPIFFFQLA